MGIASRQIAGSGVSDAMYRNGARPNIKNPIWAESARAPGTMFGHPSGPGKTHVSNPVQYPGPTKYRAGFEDDLTGYPWASPEPEFFQGGGPMGTEAMTKEGYAHSHNPSSADSGDTRAKSEKVTDSFALAVPEGLKEFWADNPVASLLFGVAFIWLANEVLFNSEDVREATTGAGDVISAPARAATSGATATTESVVESVNDAASTAVEAVEDVVGKVTGDSA